MDALDLDYQRPSQRPRLLHLLLVILAAIAVFWVTAEYNTLQQQIGERSAELQQAHQQPGVKPAQTKQEQKLSEALQKAQQEVLVRLNLPWAPLFKALESAHDPKVALLAIEPNIKSGTVRLTAETGTLQQAIGYLERLQQQSAFSGVTLSEHEIDMEAPGRPIRFTLTLNWIAT